ncbi:hypothetical protein ACJJTC_002480 [Scirpophaga incertulas]
MLKNSSGKLCVANHIYSSIPAYSLAKLVQRQHPELAVELKGIPFVTVGIVNLYFSTQESLIKPAFGFLVPPIENSPILGSSYDGVGINDVIYSAKAQVYKDCT